LAQRKSLAGQTFPALRQCAKGDFLKRRFWEGVRSGQLKGEQLE